MLGERPRPGHGSNECRRDQGSNLEGDNRGHHLAAQKQGPKAQQYPNQILPRMCGKNSTHAPFGLQGHASPGTDFRPHKQRHNHLDYEVRGPFQTRELEVYYPPQQHIQNSSQNANRKNSSIPSTCNQAKSDRICRRKKHTGQYFPNLGGLGLGNIK